MVQPSCPENNIWDKLAKIPIIGNLTSLVRIPANILQGLWGVMSLLGSRLAHSSPDYAKKQFKASADGLKKAVVECIPVIGTLAAIYIFDAKKKHEREMSKNSETDLSRSDSSSSTDSVPPWSPIVLDEAPWEEEIISKKPEGIPDVKPKETAKIAKKKTPPFKFAWSEQQIKKSNEKDQGTYVYPEQSFKGNAREEDGKLLIQIDDDNVDDIVLLEDQAKELDNIVLLEVQAKELAGRLGNLSDAIDKLGRSTAIHVFKNMQLALTEYASRGDLSAQIEATQTEKGTNYPQPTTVGGTFKDAFTSNLPGSFRQVVQKLEESPRQTDRALAKEGRAILEFLEQIFAKDKK